MTWKTLIHGEILPVKFADLKNSALQNPQKVADRTTNNRRTELPVSDTRTVLLVSAEQLIELARQKAWKEYCFQFAVSEVERVILDFEGVQHCTKPELDAWANALVIRMIQQRGQVPNGWTQKSKCAHCGTVWSERGIDTLSCGWCHLRIDGKGFPRP